MERPSWWPSSLWPAGTRRAGGAGGAAPALSLPERAPARPAGEPGREPPAQSFLRVLLAMLSAGRAAVWVYLREDGVWQVEREARIEEWPAAEAGPVSAEGHPFTWALREGLILQLPCERLGWSALEGAWTVLGVVPGSRRALTLEFPGSPPAAARRGLEAALDHLADLERAGYLRPI